MAHVSYNAPDGKGWRVELGTGEGGLLECFAMTEGDLPEWHGVLCEQGRLWEVPRRMFAVHPALGASVQEMMAQSAMEIAAGLDAAAGGVTEKDVARMMERAKTLWTRHLEAKKARGRASKADEEDAESLNERNAKAAAMLAKYGFREDDAEVRAYMIMRAGQLEPQLESDEDRPAAMQMLRDEVSLNFSVNPALDIVQAKIRRICRAPEDEREDAKLHSAQEKEAELIEASGKLRKAIEDAKKSLNLGESATGRAQKKEQMQDTWSYLNKGVRDWKARGGKTLIDGVFNEAELRVLLKPWGDRPAQYTPVPALIVGALLDGLHDPEFEQPVIKGQRNVLRKFHKAMKSALEALETEENGALENLQDDPPSADVSVLPQPVLAGEADLPESAQGGDVGAGDDEGAFG